MSSESGHQGLSQGEVIAIAVGASAEGLTLIAVITALIIILIKYWRRRKLDQERSSSSIGEFQDSPKVAIVQSQTPRNRRVNREEFKDPYMITKEPKNIPNPPSSQSSKKPSEAPTGFFLHPNAYRLPSLTGPRTEDSPDPAFMRGTINPAYELETNKYEVHTSLKDSKEVSTLPRKEKETEAHSEEIQSTADCSEEKEIPQDEVAVEMQDAANTETCPDADKPENQVVLSLEGSAVDAFRFLDAYPDEVNKKFNRDPDESNFRTVL